MPLGDDSLSRAIYTTSHALFVTSHPKRPEAGVCAVFVVRLLQNIYREVRSCSLPPYRPPYAEAAAACTEAQKRLLMLSWSFSREICSHSLAHFQSALSALRDRRLTNCPGGKSLATAMLGDIIRKPQAPAHSVHRLKDVRFGRHFMCRRRLVGTNATW